MGNLIREFKSFVLIHVASALFFGHSVGTANNVQMNEPIANLKVVTTNVDNEPDPAGDYRITRVSCDTRVMVRAGDVETVFRLYITYDDGFQEWRKVDTETAAPTNWKLLDFSYMIGDEATAADIRASGTPVEFDAIRGIRVTCDDGSVEDEILRVTPSDIPSLSVELVDGEFEGADPPGGLPTLTVEAWVEWKEELIWPENEKADMVLYTVGEQATIPIPGQTIPANFPLTLNASDAQGGFEVWRFKRCGGSWGVKFSFVDFPGERLTGALHNTATGILIRTAGPTGDIIGAISDDTFSYNPGM